MSLPKRCLYTTNLEWKGDIIWSQEGEGVRIECAPPVEFGGTGNIWTPEHLFLASIESCTLSTFLAYAKHAKIKILSYKSQTEGEMVLEGKAYRFTQVTIKVDMTVELGKGEAARTLLNKAHQRCPIARSINLPVHLKIEIKEI